jgi:signal transduction histidine kinase/CheY-like chemotaxis protein
MTKPASGRVPAARTAAAAAAAGREEDHSGPGAGAQGGNGRGGDGPGSRRDLRRETAAFSVVAHLILQEEDLDAVCRLFLEAVRQHSGYRRAVLTLFDEQGRDVQLFFTGFSDEEIDYFHAHKPGAEQRAAIVQERFRVGHSYIAPAADCEGGGLRPGTARDLLFMPLLGPGSTQVGAVMLFEPVDDARPAAEDLSPLELFAGQVAHAIQKKLLDQKIKAMQARLLAVQAQLLQAEKMSAIGLLISGVTHELNNPLSGIMGFAQLLLQSELNPKARKHLERIYNEAVRSQRIVQNLLSFARRHKPEKTYQSLNEVIDGVFELRAYQLQVDNVEVVRRYDPRLPRTMLDFHQLQQVILNVVNNAHQAMMEVPDRPRRLVVTTGQRGSGLRASFSDSGKGIASDRIESIFDPFFTTKKGGKGTGLGLSVSRAIIKDHQGSMSAESVVGEGTTIHVDLPLHEGQAAVKTSGEEEKKATGPPKPMRLLVVDDEMILVELLTEFLRTVGHKVDEARNGQKALELATANDYDAIVTDLKMPGLDGQGLYERLCKIKPHMAHRFIFSTGDLANPRTQAFFQAAGCPYLSKPFKLEAVLTILEQIGRGTRAA